MSRRSRSLLVIAGLVSLAAVVILRGRVSRAEEVDVTTPTRRETFRSFVTASGEIVATRFADIGSSVMGRIVELPVAEGDRVQRGQVLARLDPAQAESDAQAAEAQRRALEAEQLAARQQVASAQSDLDAAKARALEATQTLERTRTLQREGLAPMADADAAMAAANATAAQVRAADAAAARAAQALLAAERRVAQARAQVAGRRDLLAKTEIVAPIDGVVTRLNVRAGEMVVIGVQNQPGTILMTVSDLAEINAEVKVAEADVLRIAPGQSARVTLDALPERSFEGRVVEVGASALPVTGTGAAAREFRVVVRLDAPDPGLRPGLTCDAEILATELSDVVTVPLQAVVVRARDGAEQSGVFRVESNRAVFTPVATGIIGGLDIVVTGLEADTPIVVGPFQALRTLEDGAEVRAAAGSGGS